MSAIDDLTTAVNAAVTTMGNAVTAIEAEIAALNAAGGNTAAIEAQVTTLKTATDALAAAIPATPPTP